jgi:hypothetical protein
MKSGGATTQFLLWAPKFPWGTLGALHFMLILGSFYISTVACLSVTHYEKDVFTNFEEDKKIMVRPLPYHTLGIKLAILMQCAFLEFQ